jgi:type II secretory pathway component GspD/PulD (secretin)
MKRLSKKCMPYLAILAACFLMCPVYARAQDAVPPEEASPAARAVIDVLDLNDTDIWEIINVIVEKTGLKIIAGDNVAGRATMYLENVEARDALRVILDSNAMAYAEEEGTIYIMTSREFQEKYGKKFSEDFQTRIVSLTFADPGDVAGILNQVKSPEGKVLTDGKFKTVIVIERPAQIADLMKVIKEADVQRFTMVFELGFAKGEDLSKRIEAVLTKNVGKVRFDEKSNKLVVTDTSAKIEEARKIVNSVDRRDRQVVIEAKIIQIILNDEHRTGVDWEAIVSEYRTFKLAGDANGLSAAGQKDGMLSMGTIANEDYDILLEALDTVGTVEMLSNPSVTTANNKEARILAGTTPYATNAGASDDASKTPGSTKAPDFGLKLYVMPTIHSDSLTLNIRPVVSSTSGGSSLETDGTPLVDTSQGEITVRVKDGVTIVMGGLINEEKSRTTKKVPVLGDVPVLGMAFRSYTHNVKKTEIVIFLKPAITFIDTGSPLKEDK